MKTCTKCGATKERTEYHANKRAMDGLQNWCRTCRSEHAKATHDPGKAQAYRLANEEQIRERKRLYRLANAAQETERAASWHAANPDRVREHKRRHAAKHGDRDLRRVESWAATNPERNKAARRQRSKSIRDAAGPEYAAKVLGLKKTVAGAAMLEVKSDQLILRRLARTLKKATHERITDADPIPWQPGRGDNEGRPSADRGEQPAGAGSQGDQRHRRGSDGQGPGLDQQQPER